MGWAVVKTVITLSGDTRKIPEKSCGVEEVTTGGVGRNVCPVDTGPGLLTACQKLALTRKATI